MRAKPEMKPWVHTDKSRLSSDKERHYSASICLRQKSAAPLGLNKCVTMITQGLRPGLCRSIALTGLIYDFTANQLLCCFDALTLPNE